MAQGHHADRAATAAAAAATALRPGRQLATDVAHARGAHLREGRGGGTHVIHMALHISCMLEANRVSHLNDGADGAAEKMHLVDEEE